MPGQFVMKLFGLTPIPGRSYTRFQGAFRSRPGERGGNVGGRPGAFQMTGRNVVARRIAWFFLFSLLPQMVAGQTVRVDAEQEIFRQTPNGRRLATVLKDTPLTAGDREGQWVQVTLEGWIWAASIGATDRNGFNRLVSAPGGENLRDAPEGRVMARLLQGFLLDHVQDDGDWVKVRRTGWIWDESLTGPGAAPLQTPADPGSPPPSRPEPIAAEGQTLAIASGELGIRNVPAGDTAAVVRAGASFRIVERREGWARVRLEGWVPTGEFTTPDDSTVVNVSAAELRANPDQFNGSRVRWSVQLISLERAEPSRTDFYEGEPFILARAPDPGHGFVYLAVPPGLLDDVEEVSALRTIEILGQVRTGRSALMGVPVLDLLALY